MPKRRSAPDQDLHLLLPLTEEAAARTFLTTSPDAPDADVKQACAKALEEDPYAIEVLFTLGQRAENAQQRLEYFQRASEAAAHKPRKIVAALMPTVRLGMAETLMQDGRLSDAVEILLPALTEDPIDHQDVHHALVDLMLRLGWDDELQPLVEAFQGESAPAAFAAAMLEFRRHGATHQANQLLKRADSDYPGVASLLCGLAPMNPNFPDESAEESPAQYVASVLMPGVRDTTGAVKWIRETLADSIQAYLEKSDRPISNRQWLASAEQLPKKNSNWELALTTYIDEGERRWLGVIVQKSELLHIECYEREPKRHELKQLFLSAVTTPQSGSPHRPAKLRVSDSPHQRALADICSRLNVKLEVTKPTKKLTKLLEHTAQQMVSSRGHASPASPEHQEQLGSLSIGDDEWLLGIFRPPLFVQEGPTPKRAWLVQVARADDGMILYISAEENQPTPEQVWQVLCNLMLHPSEGSPSRPERVVVDAECWNDRFASFPGVTFERGEPEVSDYFTRLVAAMLEFQGPIKPALRNQVGVDDDMLATFYETAARFYRVSPWKMVGSDRFFEVWCDAWKNPRWAACIVGQLGQERGLTIYENPNDALAFLHSSGKKLSKLNSGAVHFSEAHHAIPVDVWNIERCGWEVADFEAVPFVGRIRGGKSIVAATADDVIVLTAVMQHAIQFIDHPADQNFAVDYQGTKLHMRWLT